MKITFCGAAQTTTGSQHLLEVNGKRILLDCGLYQGRRAEAYHRNLQFPWYEPKSIDAVLLSHAHIDHSGNLPNLVKQGFTGNIYSTAATRDLCSIMLQDCAKIQSYDTEWLNKKREKQDLPLLEPIYDQRDAELCLRSFVTTGYHRTLPIVEGVKATFLDAGHILGSAQIVLDVEEGGQKKRLLFSGDIGRGNNELLRDPESCEQVDFVLMESTYGGRLHSQPATALHELGAVLNKALAKKGKVIVPAFAVERTQQLLYAIHRLFQSGEVKQVPVYVDSPLAVNATEVFRLHPECFNRESYEYLFEQGDPFGFDGLRLIRHVSESKKLNAIEEACIIISASGMCEAGRILHHLKQGIGEEKNTILFVGYCAQNTLGRKIRDGYNTVNIFGHPNKVEADIAALDSFSGHADHEEMLSWYRKIKGTKQKTWLIHGEEDASKALKQGLQKEGYHAEVGKLGTTVEF